MDTLFFDDLDKSYRFICMIEMGENKELDISPIPVYENGVIIGYEIEVNDIIKKYLN